MALLAIQCAIVDINSDWSTHVFPCEDWYLDKYRSCNSEMMNN